MARQLLIAISHTSERNRLFVTESEEAEHGQTFIEKLVHLLLQLLVEVNKHVAAQNDLKLIEGTIGHQIMLGEDDIPA